MAIANSINGFSKWVKYRIFLNQILNIKNIKKTDSNFWMPDVGSWNLKSLQCDSRERLGMTFNSGMTQCCSYLHLIIS